MQRQFTKEGLAKLKEELHLLKTVRRQEIAERLRETSQYGDLTENSEYQETKEAQARLEAHIAELEDAIKNAVVAPEIKSAGGVEIGSIVTVQCGGRKLCFTLVGAAEAAPWEGKISVESPLGKALLKKKRGDEVMIETPDGKKRYMITEIA